MLIVMSDVYLDQAVVLERLADVFAGYEGVGAEMLRCGKELRQASPSASNAFESVSAAIWSRAPIPLNG